MKASLGDEWIALDGKVVRVNLPIQQCEELYMEPSQCVRHQRLYRRKYLLDLAEAQGVLMTSRSLTDWVVRGLVPPPEQHGLGQGKGSIAGWTQEQVGLWIALLHLYQ